MMSKLFVHLNAWKLDFWVRTVEASLTRKKQLTSAP